MADAPPPEVFINEVEFKRSLRSLGISCLGDWHQWCKKNGKRRELHHFPIDPTSAYRNAIFWRELEATYPKHWKRYQSLRRSCAADDAAEAEFARFAARYRIAMGFRALRFSGVGEKTASGYSAGFRIFLSYSALEACCKAIGREHAKICIVDPLLGNELRSISRKAFVVMQSEITNARLQKKLKEFASDVSDDIMTFARVVRHLVAHGVFTAWGLGIVSLKAANAYDKLSEVVLAHSDALLEEHCLAISRTLLNGGGGRLLRIGALNA